MTAQTVGMVGNMAAACSVLASLPLDDLPAIAYLDVRPGGEISLQLGAAGERAAALWAWAQALSGEARAYGADHPEYIRVEIRTVVEGVPIVVWGHFTDDLMDTSSFLSIPTDGHLHPLPLAALKLLAAHRAARHG